MTLREQAIADGRIIRYRRTAAELDALGFHAAAAAARYAPLSARAAIVDLVA